MTEKYKIVTGNYDMIIALLWPVAPTVSWKVNAKH
jgi:hypothetical protein